MFDYAISTHVNKGREKTIFILLTGKALGYYDKSLDSVTITATDIPKYSNATENKILPIKQLKY